MVNALPRETIGVGTLGIVCGCAAQKGIMRSASKAILNLALVLGTLEARNVQAAPWPFEGLPLSSIYDEGFGWVVADQPSTAGYTPGKTRQYNSAGGTSSVTREGVGRYRVVFPGLGGIHGGNVQVTALGDGPTHCKVRHWSSLFPTTTVSVACFDAGAAADGAFVASYQASRTTTPIETAYAWVPATATGVSYTPTAAYGRNVTSVYRPTDAVLLAGPTTSLALEHVTAYGNGADHCVFREGRAISCFDASGNRMTNPAFSFATGLGRISTSIPSPLEGAFGVMDLPWDWVTTTTATPQGSTLSSGAMTVTRTGTGRYSVDVPYPRVFASSNVPSMVHVTALDITGRNHATQCKVASWSDDGTTRVSIQVRCFAMSPASYGTPQDMGFRVSYIVRPAPFFFFPFVPLDLPLFGK